MPLLAIRIDARLWESATQLRRDDWRTSIVDLLDDAKLGAEDDHTLHLSVDGEGLALVTFDENGGAVATHVLAPSHLAHHTEEYLAIIRRMQDSEISESSSRMQALDMAKKVVHDGGARTLASTLPGFAPDHETYRRLFTLLLSVVVDVTSLPGVNAHRRHLG